MICLPLSCVGASALTAQRMQGRDGVGASLAKILQADDNFTTTHALLQQSARQEGLPAGQENIAAIGAGENPLADGTVIAMFVGMAMVSSLGAFALRKKR